MTPNAICWLWSIAISALLLSTVTPFILVGFFSGENDRLRTRIRELEREFHRHDIREAYGNAQRAKENAA